MDGTTNHQRQRRLGVCVAVTVVVLAAAEARGLPGVVVEKVESGSAAEKAGLRPDDVLLSWTADRPGTRSQDGGDMATIFDWVRVEIEEVPRGGLGFDLVRGADQHLEVRLQPGLLGIEVRPRMSDPALEAYEAALEKSELAPSGEHESTVVHDWQTLVDALEDAGDIESAWWLEMRSAELSAGEQRWEEARDCLSRAVELVAPVGDDVVETLTRRKLGDQLSRLDRVEEARAQYDRAEATIRTETGDTISLALVLGRRGLLEQKLGNSGDAVQLFRDELVILDRLAPRSLGTAACMHLLGGAVHRRGEFAEAEQLYLQALALRIELAPGSILVGFTSNNLGHLARQQGDLEAADRFLNQALEFKIRARPESVTVAHTYNNLGLVATARGHYETAEGHFRQALAIYRQKAPESRHPGTVLNNLAEVQINRHRWRDALDLLDQALAVHQEAEPGSVSAARTLGNLGFVYSELENLDEAERNYQLALEIFQVHAPDGIDVAKIENNLGEIAWQRRELGKADELYRISLDKKRRLAPGGLLVANTLASFGHLQRDLDDDRLAEESYQEALTIAETLAPGSKTEARILHLFGVLRRDQNDAEAAVAFFRRAIDALEAQVGRLGGGDEVRAGYRADHMVYYHDLIDLLLETGREGEAFHVLERSRAQVLLAMLAERDVVFSADVPPELDRRRRLNGVAYDRAQQRLAELSRDDVDEIAEVTEELRRLRRQHEEIRQEIRRSSPRFAALAYPAALDLAAARRTVNRGTVVLSYSVGRDHTLLFALDASGGMRVETIDCAENDLHDAVSLFRGLVEAGAEFPGEQGLLIDAGKSLYRRLVAPVEDLVSTAERLIIIPDGVLHLLPFSALAREDRDGVHYLVEWKPLTTVASLTVFSQVREDRTQDRGSSVVVFADPAYLDGESESRRLIQRGQTLEELPGSRAEAETITALYGDGATTWLGPQATETRSKQLTRDTSMVHFAAHVIFTETAPLDSGIALSVPINDEPENGLLQAWEIFESIRIDADLVTLSGCHTAVGKHIAGEGLIGLTRAFQYAGARTVLASLWRVEDQTTAELMRRFYGQLRAGESKDQALRLAQLEMIRGPISLTEPGGGLMASIGSWFRGLFGGDEGRPFDASHPFFWAAFKIEGDWR